MLHACSPETCNKSSAVLQINQLDANVLHCCMQLAPKERQLQDARSANTALSEQVRRLSSQVTNTQKDLQRVQEETHNQIRVGCSVCAYSYTWNQVSQPVCCFLEHARSESCLLGC